MILSNLQVTTTQGVVKDFPLLDDNVGSYTVENIDGLDPINAEFVFSSFAGQDGSTFQNARRGNRQIVVTLGYNPNYANTEITVLRRALYKIFMPKSNLKLGFFENTGGTLEIFGRVESIVAPRFGKDPKVVITMICEDPDFQSSFEFESSQFNTTSGTTTLNYGNNGDLDIGAIFTVYVNRTISGFTIYCTGLDNIEQSLVFSYPMLAGDKIRISTRRGNKFATLTRGGITTSVLYGVSPVSTWIQLTPGINKLRILLAGAAVPWTITKRDKYGGL